LLPELLRAIFKNLERIDQVRCALVNTAWSEIALDQVWYDIDDLRLLLNALSPLEKDGSRKYASHSSDNILNAIAYRDILEI